MTQIFVRFQVEGWHKWPDATQGRAYLSSKHRHLFHIKASCAVTHDNREIEFHDLMDFCKAEFGQGDFGAMSCETLAKRLATACCEQFHRRFTVTVSEDGECGATVIS